MSDPVRDRQRCNPRLGGFDGWERAYRYTARISILGTIMIDQIDVITQNLRCDHTYLRFSLASSSVTEIGAHLA